MSAALRYAARRLGGAGAGVLQRSMSPIVAEEGRRLPARARLLHTPTKGTAVEDANIMASRFCKIQEKKEELYDLVADFQRTYKTPFRISWQNGELLLRLSTQIEPRPSDPYWRMLRRDQRKTSFFTYVGLSATAIAVAYPIAYGILWTKKSYGKDFEDWWNQQITRGGAKKRYAKDLEDWWNKQIRCTGAKERYAEDLEDWWN